MGIYLHLSLDFCRGQNGVGSHRANIMEAIDRFGSIAAAGPAVDLTYSQIWRVIRILNSLCDEPFVGMRRGGRTGGAFLTPKGKDVLARFREIERVIRESTAPHIRELEKIVGVDKTPTVIPRYAQIIDPTTLPAPKKPKRSPSASDKQKRKPTRKQVAKKKSARTKTKSSRSK
jgi:molybdate transport system regulatory protein